MKSDEKMESWGVSRRQMMIGTGALAAGATMAHFGGLLKSAQAKGGPTEKWPWRYEDR